MKGITHAHSTSAERIHPLTALRFFAALFVVLFHTLAIFFPSVRPHQGLGRLFSLGYISVSFFFFLSGYILAFVYLRRSKPLTYIKFYQARFARIYPLLLLTLVLDFPFLFLDKFHRYGTGEAFLKSGVVFTGAAALLQAWAPQFKGINSPSWSLSVEAVFYLLFPFLGPALWKLRGAGLWVAAACFYFGGQTLVFLTSFHMSLDFCERLPLLHLSTFGLGILLARWQALVAVESPTFRKTDANRRKTICVLCVCALAVLAWFSPHSTSIEDCLCDGLLAPIFAGVIWVLSDAAFLPARFLSASWLVILGEASFGLYLFHAPMIHLFSYLGLLRGPALFPVYLGASIGISILSFYYFETPARQWILRGRRVEVQESVELASDAQ